MQNQVGLPPASPARTLHDRQTSRDQPELHSRHSSPDPTCHHLDASCRRLPATCCTMCARSSQAEQPVSPTRLPGGYALPSPAAARVKARRAPAGRGCVQANLTPEYASRARRATKPIAVDPRAEPRHNCCGSRAGGCRGRIHHARVVSQAWGAAQHAKCAGAGAGLCASLLLVVFGRAGWGCALASARPWCLPPSRRCWRVRSSSGSALRVDQAAAVLPARRARAAPCC